MGTYRSIASLSHGMIEKVYIVEGAYVHEWEPLFLIKTTEGLTRKVELGAAGLIAKVHVQEGDIVNPDTTLAILEDSTHVSSCD